jgi:hypothetical protein
MATMMGGPTIEATLVPALKIPVANARSRLGNHSATDLMAAGKLPDSPKPSIPRQKPRFSGEPVRAWKAAASDHQVMATA